MQLERGGGAWGQEAIYDIHKLEEKHQKTKKQTEFSDSLLVF